MSTFELFRDENKDLCFRLKTASGKILLTSEGFSSLSLIHISEPTRPY